jgi:hypothetical protein
MTMSTLRAMTFALAAGTALAAASPAGAAVTICLGGGCAGGNPASNVLFTDNLSGTSINATLNNAPGIVTFSSLETLKTQANGQARIFANDGVLNNPLTITYAAGLISKLELNVDAITSGNISFTFAGGDSDGVVLGPYALGSSGSNFYNAFNGTFKSVTVSFLNGATVSDVSQVRVTTAAAVPEPATWALMLFGFGAVGVSLRSRNRKTKPSFA